MSLFDSYYLKEKIECPCGKEIHDFQSKDLDCCLDEYTINEEGVLECQDYKMVLIPKEERDSFGLPIAKKEILGYYKSELTDTLNLYSSCPHGKHWVDLILTYIEGKLINKKVNISEMD